MSRGIQKIIIIGNVGQDPEMKTTNSGNPVCNFSLAVSESWTDKNTKEKKEHTEWIDIEAYGRLAEICGEYIKKGSKVYIEGALRKDTWDDRQTGVKMQRTKVKAREMQLLDSRQSSGQHQEPAGQPAQQDDFSDDVPF